MKAKGPGYEAVPTVQVSSNPFDSNLLKRTAPAIAPAAGRLLDLLSNLSIEKGRRQEKCHCVDPAAHSVRPASWMDELPNEETRFSFYFQH